MTMSISEAPKELCPYDRENNIYEKRSFQIQSAGMRILGQSLCRLYARLQILLCVLYEAVHRPRRAVGDLFGCKALAGDQKPAKICGQGIVPRLCHRPLSAAGGAIRAHTRFTGAASRQRRKAQHRHQKRPDPARFGLDQSIPRCSGFLVCQYAGRGFQKRHGQRREHCAQAGGNGSVLPRRHSHNLFCLPHFSGHYGCRSDHPARERAVPFDLAGKSQSARQLQDRDYGVHTKHPPAFATPLPGDL